MPKSTELRKAAREAGKEEQASEAIEDSERYASLESVANSEGGKLLIAAAKEDAVNAIEILSGSYRTATHAELVAHCATLAAHLALYRTLTNAHKNKTQARAAVHEILESA